MVRIGLKPVQVMAKTIQEDATFFGPRKARGGQSKRERNALFGIGAPLAHHTLGQGTRSLDIRDVIHQI